ncbi:MAG: BolA family transcriptional regulator [Gammaproteobacteria bacterium]|nr:BolA family transcriptional regulator [Gammaproteobacteria bacterium]
MNKIDLMKARLQTLQPSYLEIIDDGAAHAGHHAAGGGHFTLIIRSPLFADQTQLKRHQMIYAALGDLFPHAIHALSIQIKS